MAGIFGGAPFAFGIDSSMLGAGDARRDMLDESAERVKARRRAQSRVPGAEGAAPMEREREPVMADPFTAVDALLRGTVPAYSQARRDGLRAPTSREAVEGGVQMLPGAGLPEARQNFEDAAVAALQGDVMGAMGNTGWGALNAMDAALPGPQFAAPLAAMAGGAGSHAGRQAMGGEKSLAERIREFRQTKANAPATEAQRAPATRAPNKVTLRDYEDRTDRLKWPRWHEYGLPTRVDRQPTPMFPDDVVYHGSNKGGIPPEGFGPMQQLPSRRPEYEDGLQAEFLQRRWANTTDPEKRAAIRRELNRLDVRFPSGGNSPETRQAFLKELTRLSSEPPYLSGSELDAEMMRRFPQAYTSSEAHPIFGADAETARNYSGDGLYMLRMPRGSRHIGLSAGGENWMNLDLDGIREAFIRHGNDPDDVDAAFGTRDTIVSAATRRDMNNRGKAKGEAADKRLRTDTDSVADVAYRLGYQTIDIANIKDGGPPYSRIRISLTPENIEVLKKLGIAGLVAAGGATVLDVEEAEAQEQ